MIIGFVGLGAMGAGIAASLIKAGYDLLVYDLRTELIAPHVEAGAREAASLEALGREADVVFTSLPGPVEMKAVAFADGGLVSVLRPGAVWFDLTTNAPAVVREVAAACAPRGITLMDAPVSGRPVGARSGKLAVFIGGDEAAFERYRPVLDAIGDQILYVGEVGSGNVTKLVHNCTSLVIRMVLVEGFTLGVKAGMEPLALLHALRQGAIGRMRTFDILSEQYLSDQYTPPSFALELAHKDFRLALELAREVGVPMKQAELAFEDYNLALDRGWGTADSRSPMQLQNERAAVTIRLAPEAIRETLAR